MNEQETRTVNLVVCFRNKKITIMVERERYIKICSKSLRTLQTVGVEKVLALLVALDTAFRAPNALARDSPQQALALVAISGRGGTPQDEIVRRRRGNGINQRLKTLLVHVHLQLLVV